MLDLYLQGLLLKKLMIKDLKFISYINKWHNNNISRLESSLNFFNDLNFIDKYIFGLESLSQLKQIIKTKKLIIDFPKFDEKYKRPKRMDINFFILICLNLKNNIK